MHRAFGLSRFLPFLRHMESPAAGGGTLMSRCQSLWSTPFSSVLILIRGGSLLLWFLPKETFHYGKLEGPHQLVVFKRVSVSCNGRWHCSAGCNKE